MSCLYPYVRNIAASELINACWLGCSYHIRQGKRNKRSLYLCFRQATMDLLHSASTSIRSANKTSRRSVQSQSGCIEFFDETNRLLGKRYRYDETIVGGASIYWPERWLQFQPSHVTRLSSWQRDQECLWNNYMLRRSGRIKQYRLALIGWLNRGRGVWCPFSRGISEFRVQE